MGKAAKQWRNGVVASVKAQQKKLELPPEPPDPPPPQRDGLLSVGVSYFDGIEYRTSTELITPEQAQKWIDESNINNRTLRESKVDQIQLDMRNDDFNVNGESIVFDYNGRLINGQHRLYACIRENKAFVSVIVRGVHPRAYETTDSHAARRTYDVLHDLPNGSRVCASVRLIWYYDQHGPDMRNCRREIPTRSQETAFITENYNALQEAMVVTHNQGLSRIAMPSVIGLCSFLFTREYPEAAARFFRDLTQRTDLQATNPVIHLIKRLDENSRNRAKLPTHHQIALFFRAFSYYRENQPMKILRLWKPDGPVPELYPEF